jgi:hypothetical protein
VCVVYLTTPSGASNGTIINKYWIGKDVEGSGSGLFDGTIPAFAWRKRETPQKKTQSGYWLSRPRIETGNLFRAVCEIREPIREFS